MAAPRTAKQVIDQIIKENRPWERFCFVVASAFVSVGLSAIVRAMLVAQSDVLTVAGATRNFLLWPAFHHARRIRKENQAMRLLEIPLSRAETVKAAANMIHEMFVEIFVNRRG